MASVRKVDIVWTGLQGAPYYTQLYFGFLPASAGPTVTAVTAFLNALKSYVLSGLSAQIQTEQQIIDTATGLISGVETASGGAPVAMTAAGPTQPPATQGLLKMSTDAFLAGRRLRGRLYLPGASQNWGAATPAPAYQTAVTAAGTALMSATSGSGNWSVYSRTHKGVSPITGVSTWSQWAVMRSRRD